MQWMRYFAPILGVVVLLVIGLGLLIFMSSDSNDETTDQANAKLLKIDYGSAFKSLDPQGVSWSHEIRMMYGLYEGLLIPDPQSNGFLPGVAEKWELDEETGTWTFTLRQDAKWSDGSPVTARDFHFSWAHGALMPDFTPYYNNFFDFIKGIPEIKDQNQAAFDEMKKAFELIDNNADLSGEQKEQQKFTLAQQRIDAAMKRFDQQAGLKIVDDYTLQVTMNNYLPYFLDIMAFPTMMPLKANELKASYQVKDESSGQMVWNVDLESGLLVRKEDWFTPGMNSYNGPYVLKDHSNKKHLKIRPNPEYWNKSQVKNDGVDAMFYDEGNLLLGEYEKGNLNMLFGASTIKRLHVLLEQQEKGERNDILDITVYGTYYLALNARPQLVDGRNNPLANPLVRKALALAVNRTDITVKVNKLGQPNAHTFVPPGIYPGYESPAGVKYDPDQARALLAQAGYPNGDGLPAIEIIFNSGGGHGDRMTAVAGEWKQTLGINVTTREITITDLSDRTRRGDFMVARSGWIADYVEPSSLLDLFKTGVGNNKPGFSDPEYDSLMNQAQQEKDKAKRLALYSQAETILMDQHVPVIPIYHYVFYYMFDPDKITGVSTQNRATQIFSLIEVK